MTARTAAKTAKSAALAAAVAASLTLFSLAGPGAVRAAYAQQKMTPFSDLGTGKVAPAPDVPTEPSTKPQPPSGAKADSKLPAPPKMPAGAEMIRQLTAPLNAKGDSVVLNVYKKNGDIFVDALTGKGGQPPIPRNHIRLKSPLPLRPDQMTVAMRPLKTGSGAGIEVVMADEGGAAALVFPSGFGGTVYQQLFVTTTAAGVRRAYDFAQNDSRGVAMVKGTVEGSGAVEPKSDVQFWVWNGKAFVPRKAE